MNWIHLIILIGTILTCQCWGPIGHSLVARLAQSQLNSLANDWIENYIPWNLNNDLSAIASWPDLLLYADSNPFDYRTWQWSHELHFTDIPDWSCNYVPTRDCLNNRCIESALKNYSSRLVDNNCDYVQQQQALFFLVHFLGDIHQPLHSGFKGDFGGNAVKGFFLNGSILTNLHAVWDVEIIDARINRFFKSDVNLYYEYLKTLMLSEESLFKNESYNDYKLWISESIDYVCKQIYFDDNDMKLNVSTSFKLGENYFNRSWPIVDQRLAQAGFRLSRLLNNLAEHKTSKKLSPFIQALIFFLCMESVILIIAIVGIYAFKRCHQKKTELLLSEES